MSKPAFDNSVLIRENWAPEVLLAANQESVFSPYLGEVGANTAVTNASNMIGGGNGHDVVFQGMGAFTGRFFERDEDASGKGQKQRLFSTKCRAHWFRTVVELYNKYDRMSIGSEAALSIPAMRRQLTASYVAWHDQDLFDAAQGFGTRTLSPSAENRATNGKRFVGETVDSKWQPKFGFDELQEIENIAATGRGFDWGERRIPMPSMRMNGMNSMWVLMIDPDVHRILKTDSGFQNIVKDADVRGMANKLLTPMLGTVGQVMIVKMPTAFGTVVNNTPVGYRAFTDTSGTVDSNNPQGMARRFIEVQSAGMRQYDENSRWTGQEGFETSSQRWSRCVLLGPNALQVAFSALPFLTIDTTHTNGIEELALHVFKGTQKAKYDAEAQGDYDDGKAAGIDWGIQCFDVRVK